MIYREFKIKENHDDKRETLCYFCQIKRDYEESGLDNPKKMAESYIEDYIRNGEGTIFCYHCGPVRYERFKNGWVEVRLNAVPI